MKRMIGGIVLVTMGVSASLTASAGDLVLNGRVVRIANTGNNQDVFSIEVAGGTQNLCSSVWINFPASAVSSPEIYKRAYATALTALTTGLLVRVYNYQSNSCDQASYIELSAG